jgi:hypothetical protein
MTLITMHGRLAGTVFVPNNWKYVIVPNYSSNPATPQGTKTRSVERGYNPHDIRGQPDDGRKTKQKTQSSYGR